MKRGSPSQTRLAILRGEDASFSSIVQLLGRFAPRVELVQDLDEARTLANEIEPQLIGLLLPLHVRDGESGIPLCLGAKADPLLSRIPIIGLAPSKDRSILSAFYGAGADSVSVVPFDIEHVFMQAEALSRLHLGVQETLAFERDKASMTSGTIGALNTTREPLVVFNAEYKPVFLNDAAKAVLLAERGIRPDQLSILADELKAELRLALQGKPIPRKDDAHESTKAGIATAYQQLIGERGLPVGVAVRLSTGADSLHLRDNLEILFRSQSLALLGSAALLVHLNDKHHGYPLTPLQQFLASIPKETSSVNLSPLLTALTEILDSVFPGSLEVSISIDQDSIVLVRPSDAVQMIGHLLLYSALRCGRDGEISVEATPNAEGGQTSLLISAEHGKSRIAVRTDVIAEAIAEFRNAASSSSQVRSGSRLLHGLDAAQAIADRYRLRLEHKSTLTHTKVRVLLPAK